MIIVTEGAVIVAEFVGVCALDDEGVVRALPGLAAELDPELGSSAAWPSTVVGERCGA